MIKFRGTCLVTRDVLQLRKFYETVLQIDGEGDAQFTAFALNGYTLTLYVCGAWKTWLRAVWRTPGQVAASSNSK